jgi:hypothetical protein
MKNIFFFKNLINLIYVYCTDFIISIANITGLSYYEINFLLFCLVYPVILVSSALFYMINKIKCKRKSRKNTIYCFNDKSC